MADLLGTFKRRAEDMVDAINRRGGLSGTIESLRKQMAASDQRRAVAKAKDEINRLDRQIIEMITAVGVQAVGLHRSGHLNSPELQPLCQHIAELEAALAAQKAELASLELTMRESAPSEAGFCPACGKQPPEGATFCPYCGTTMPASAPERFCVHCGARLRAASKFCPRCGKEAAA
jgi:hypothetical protein